MRWGGGTEGYNAMGWGGGQTEGHWGHSATWVCRGDKEILGTQCHGVGGDKGTQCYGAGGQRDVGNTMSQGGGTEGQ